jgi:hypothetical protein
MRARQELASGAERHREGTVGAVLSVVQVVPKEGEPELRVRSNLPPVLGSQMLKALAEGLGGDY